MEDTKELITTDDIRSKVYIIRGQQVMLDKDLAEIYLEDMKSRGERPNNENAVKWLCEYENNHLYEQL